MINYLTSLFVGEDCQILKRKQPISYLLQVEELRSVYNLAAELLALLLSRKAPKPHGVSGYWILYLDLCIKTHAE